MTSYEFLLWKQYHGETLFLNESEDYRAALSVKQLLAPHIKSEIPLKDLLLLRKDEEQEEIDQEFLVKKCQAFFGTMDRHKREEV